MSHILLMYLADCQAVARDDLFPKALECINVFGYGSPKGDEPHYSLIMTASIALIGVAIASLDSIAGIITSFFLLTYAIVNWTCFVLSITGAPNFRPTWKYVARTIASVVFFVTPIF